MQLRYELEDAGWATVTLECEGQLVQMTASYLYDSLRDLASGTRALAGGAPEAKVPFMDEPGEHELIMRRLADGDVELEVVWYDDWRSSKRPNIVGTRKLTGRASLAQVRGQVLSELHRLLGEYGEHGYRKKWIQHDFPTDEMHDLERTE